MKEHFRDEYELIIEIGLTADCLPPRPSVSITRARDALKLGYFVMRSPASKSPIDVVAVSHRSRPSNT